MVSRGNVGRIRTETKPVTFGWTVREGTECVGYPRSQDVAQCYVVPAYAMTDDNDNDIDKDYLLYCFPRRIFSKHS